MGSGGVRSFVRVAEGPYDAWSILIPVGDVVVEFYYVGILK